jgi:hypothetical protein
MGLLYSATSHVPFTVDGRQIAPLWLMRISVWVESEKGGGSDGPHGQDGALFNRVG